MMKYNTPYQWRGNATELFPQTQCLPLRPTKDLHTRQHTGSKFLSLENFLHEQGQRQARIENPRSVPRGDALKNVFHWENLGI
jgi:hypothetical protein